MQSVESRVCNNLESGTDDKLKISFKSTKSNSSGWTSIHPSTHCSTAVLDESGKNNWGKGETETWGYQRWGDENHNFLGSCAREFRPSDYLEFQVEITENRWLWGNDHVEICHLRVTFGNKDQTGSSTWEWSGDWDYGNGKGAWTRKVLVHGHWPTRTLGLQMKKMNPA